MFEGRHYQIAYVTRDVEAATERFLAQADARLHTIVESDIEVGTPDGRKPLHLKMAFIWVGDVQYELIQPLKHSDLFSPFVPEDGSLRLHHLAQRVADWSDFRSRVSQQAFPVVMENQFGDMRVLFLDARPVLGHYLEYAYMPDEFWTRQGGR